MDEEMRNQLGRYKTWLNRLQSYLSPLSFIMVLYLYIIAEPLGIMWQIWVVILILFLASVLAFDIIIIFPSEQSYAIRKNPEWIELRDDVKEIRAILLKEDEGIEK